MIRLGQARETEAEFRERMLRLELDMAELALKDPAEVVGDPQEAGYYCLKLSEALKAGEQETARKWTDAMLKCAPSKSVYRLIAAAAYHQLGDEGEEALQLGVGLALEPGNYALHPHLARLLLKRGERAAAAAVLEQGWLYKKKHLTKKDQAAARDQFFAVLDQAPQ